MIRRPFRVATLAACLVAPAALAVPAGAQQAPVAYLCDDGTRIDADFAARPGFVVLILNAFDAKALPAAEGSEGRRFEDGALFFAPGDDGARMKLDDGPAQFCPVRRP